MFVLYQAEGQVHRWRAITLLSPLSFKAALGRENQPLPSCFCGRKVASTTGRRLFSFMKKETLWSFCVLWRMLNEIASNQECSRAREDKGRHRSCPLLTVGLWLLQLSCHIMTKGLIQGAPVQVRFRGQSLGWMARGSKNTCTKAALTSSRSKQ